MRGKCGKLLLWVLFLAGLMLIGYPLCSEAWNAHTQTRAVLRYNEEAAAQSARQREEEYRSAEAYNGRLGGLEFPFRDWSQAGDYDGELDSGGDGIMGVLRIPSIDVELPIYHGTSGSVLQKGVGHLEGTSLPVGGSGTHAVLTTHRGLPTSRLFTDLDKVKVGDRFTVTVCGRVLTYEVDRIITVLPDERDELLPAAGEDFCTLMTCTPYGINTHRLLVRGMRVETAEEPTAKTEEREPWWWIPLAAAPLVIVFAAMRKRNSNIRD